MVTADCRGDDGKDVQTWAECIRIGELLADEALRIVQDAPVQENPQLHCASKDIVFLSHHHCYALLLSPRRWDMRSVRMEKSHRKLTFSTWGTLKY